jgi:TonB family protein
MMEWTRWEGHVVNGAFPLRRLLGSSDHSAVFLSEYAEERSEAALKLLPSNPATAKAQLQQWQAATRLTHPHLLRLIDFGRCQLGEQHFLYLAMDYAPEQLSQVLAQRALTASEARELLVPVVDALAFLHRKQLVHGRLKPANVLVVGDQIKLSSDSIRGPGQSTAVLSTCGAYDPPEARKGRISPAGDVWTLGLMTVEALTQRVPEGSDTGLDPDAILLTADLEPDLVRTVRRCLSHDPADRPTIAFLETQLTGRLPRAPHATADESPITDSEPQQGIARRAQSLVGPLAQRVPSLVVPLAVVVAVAVLLWIGLHLARRPTHPASPLPSGAASAAASASAAAGANQVAQSSTPSAIAGTAARATAANAANGAVLAQSVPKVSLASRKTIHGHVKVAVRVSVDRAGHVIGASLEAPGPSRYFARLAQQAAREWRFVPAHDAGRREWLLWFDFSRDGTTARVAPPS